jgi:response regulator RpfG family c-di-GMP phosphodiesterase
MSTALPTSLDQPAAAPVATLLCVDDEPNILSSLRRLFRPRGYKVLTAESGAAGLALLESEPVDLVISDMRMPQMDGAAFLEQVRLRRPDALRLLLTGYSDITSILAAINRGEIDRYLTKPWDDNDILLQVRHALERRALEQLAQRQAEELRVLNASLEAKVAQRTAELSSANGALAEANGRLKSNFVTTIKILSGMIELRGGHLPGHARRVADLARQIGTRMGLDARAVHEVFIAALLHDVGKIGFSDTLLTTPVSALGGEALGQYRSYPVRGERMLMPLADLHSAAAMVRSHTERFDGQGFPDGIGGALIPLGARILAVAADYDNLQLGMLSQRKLAPSEAKALIYDSSGKRYDPQVVAALRAVLDGEAPPPLEDVNLPARELRAGMVLARDIVGPDGMMLLSADHVLDARLVEQLLQFERTNRVRLSIWVWPKKET